MILSAPLPWRDDEWKVILRQAIRDTESLRKGLNLQEEDIDWIEDPDFPLLVPEPFLSRMERENPMDPLLLQVAPSSREQAAREGYTKDPLREQTAEVALGTLHKYRGRVLHIASPACPIHCRYCFRQHYPYPRIRDGATQSMLDFVRNDKSITEVILSGGDPLTLSDLALKKILVQIASVHHVTTVRFHTRFSVVIPQRITAGLLDCLRNTRLRVVVVTHINHPNEINSMVATSTDALRKANVMLLNQSVLLRNINDSRNVLTNLSHRLFDIGVTPYYLHLLDKVEGTAHFDVPEQEAMQLHGEIQSELPGYLVPRLVREVPGSTAKTLISQSPSEYSPTSTQTLDA